MVEFAGNYLLAFCGILGINIQRTPPPRTNSTQLGLENIKKKKKKIDSVFECVG